MNEQALRAQICDIGKNLWNRGMVAANDGNISARLPQDEILCTSTGVSKGYLMPEILVKVNMKGEMLETVDGVMPSSVKVHLRLYDLSGQGRGSRARTSGVRTVFAVKGEALVGKMMPEPRSSRCRRSRSRSRGMGPRPCSQSPTRSSPLCTATRRAC